MKKIDLQTARQARISKILGANVNMVDLEYTVAWMEACIAEPKLLGARQLIVTGFHGLNQAKRDPHYFRIGAECDLYSLVL